MTDRAFTDRESEACAYFFVLWWAALVLEPGRNRTVRASLAQLGLVEPRGRLALTRLGKSVISTCQMDGRPHYPRKWRKRKGQ